MLTHRRIISLFASTLLPASAFVAASTSSSAHADVGDITYLYQSDFANGTLQIREAGTYILAEDISFNPHPAGSLGDDGVTVLDAYSAGNPFFSQFGDPADGKYDPAAFGIGFFAAIAISANDVELDLNGHTIEQSAEHALLQRFFAVIELADQPFVPGQGPSDFGGELIAAKDVWIHDGIIGRSSHHGIHGNDNHGVVIEDVDFVDFEVGAVALNGARGLEIRRSNADNRDDVPILGTFSNARFISAYVDWLVATGSTTTLTVQGSVHTASDIQAALRAAINNAHEDIIVDGLGFIDATEHPAEYGLFHNAAGVVDGNAYGYLVNPLGVAVLGFPLRPTLPARDITFEDVHITSQRAIVSEVIALNQGGPATDPVGAVFMVRNVHPTTGAPLTVSSLDESVGTYTGNVLANAQALVAKADANGEFPSFLDTSRLNITPAIIDWIENQDTLDTLVDDPSDYFCNADTMFHVNKGVIGFKMDGARELTMVDTSVANLENLGGVGSDVCGNYSKSHPAATLLGYGGARVRGYSFAGSKDVNVSSSTAVGLRAEAGSAIGFDVMTNSKTIVLDQCTVDDVEAGLSFVANGGPNETPEAIGFHVGTDARAVTLSNYAATNLTAFGTTAVVDDDSGLAAY